MFDYFEVGYKIVNRIVSVIKTKSKDFAFLAGGGFGYESVKYNNYEIGGDYDLICLVSSLDEIEAILSDKNAIAQMGFDISGSSQVYCQDLKLFDDEIVSLIRFSGRNCGFKTTINFSTFDRLINIFCDRKTIKTYKIAHGRNIAQIMMAYGLAGSRILMPMLYPEVSHLYNDDNLHVIFPDRFYYICQDEVFMGSLSDWLAKGRIVLDNSTKQLEYIQNSILVFMKVNASQEILRNQEWHKMFASHHLFPEKFTRELCLRIDNLQVNEYVQSIQCKDVDLIISMADDDWYNFHHLSSYSKDLRIPSSYKIQYSLGELVIKDLTEEIEFDLYMKSMSAEVKRLTTLFAIAKHNLEYEYYFDNSVSNFNLNEVDELVPFNETRCLINSIELFRTMILSDYDKYANLISKKNNLINKILLLRVKMYKNLVLMESDKYYDSILKMEKFIEQLRYR